jgi:hypothetical protein
MCILAAVVATLAPALAVDSQEVWRRSIPGSVPRAMVLDPDGNPIVLTGTV